MSKIFNSQGEINASNIKDALSQIMVLLFDASWKSWEKIGLEKQYNTETKLYKIQLDSLDLSKYVKGGIIN